MEQKHHHTVAESLRNCQHASDRKHKAITHIPIVNGWSQAEKVVEETHNSKPGQSAQLNKTLIYLILWQMMATTAMTTSKTTTVMTKKHGDA